MKIPGGSGPRPGLLSVVAAILLMTSPAGARPPAKARQSPGLHPTLRIDEATCASVPPILVDRDYLIVPPRHKARSFPVVEIRRVFDSGETDKAKLAKKSIAEDNPVLFTGRTPTAAEIVGGLWKPSADATRGRTTGRRESECASPMIVVGYDDAKHGGAFEVMRECPTDSFFWIRYEDFNQISGCGIEVIGNHGSTKPSIELSGTVRFQDGSGASMRAQRQGRAYRLEGVYPSATRFRVLIASNGPAYVYVFASDLSGQIAPLFPKQGSSAYLASAEHPVAIPDDKDYLHLDDRPGTDYLCALYSTRKLDFSALVQQMDRKQGELMSRLQAVLGKEVVPEASVRDMSAGEVSFFAQSTDGSVLPVIVEIHHVK